MFGVTSRILFFGISFDYNFYVFTTIRSIIMTRGQRAGGLKAVLVAISGRCRFSMHSGFLRCFRGYGMT